MNPYHAFQGRAASQEPELQTKVRFWRKFVLCCWFFSLAAGFNHFCVQLLCGLTNKQGSPRNSCITIFFLHLKKRLPAFKCIPCWQREVTFYTASPPPYGPTWSLLDKCANSITKIQDFAKFSGHPSECQQTAHGRYLTDLLSESSYGNRSHSSTHLPNRKLFSSASPVMIQAPHPLCCAAKLQRARFLLPSGIICYLCAVFFLFVSR